MEKDAGVKQPTYIFPDFLAKWMSKVDQRTQYEASMLSMSLLIIGMILSAVYALIYTDFALWFKIVLVINGFFGCVFMWSYIVTTYQQYLAYMEAVQMDEVMKQAVPDVKEITSEDLELMKQYLPEAEIAKILKQQEKDERRSVKNAKAN